MKEQKINEELLSRKDFFKKTAKNVLPILGVMVLGPTLLNGCDPIDGGGSTISGCGKSCSGSCEDGCTNNCDSLCGGDCWAYCESKVKV